MSRALELLCCHYLLSPCSGPSTSVSFRLTRLPPLHSHTQLSLCDVSLLLLLFISRCLPALLVLAFYETFQKIAFMMLLLTLCFVYISDVLLHSVVCWWILPFFSPLFSLLRVVMVVLSVFVFFVHAPVYWCDPRGFVLHGLRKNLTNFECVYFLFPSKIVYFLCALFLSPCVCLKTQNATPKCTQPNPSAPKGSLILLHALDLPLFACANKQLGNVKIWQLNAVCQLWQPKFGLKNDHFLNQFDGDWWKLIKKTGISHIDRCGVVHKVRRAINIHSALFFFVFVCVFGCFDGYRKGG